MPTPFRVSLPAPMKAWVQRRLRQKCYATASENVAQLLRHDQFQDASDRVDAKLLQALDSGEAKPMTAEDWQHIRTGEQRAVGQGRRTGRLSDI